MLPMPPPELRFKVAGVRDEGHFDTSGRQSATDIARALAGVGRSLPEFPRILEWGCGCGRILRHLPVDLASQDVHGCDIDAEAIAWLQAEIPAFNAVVNAGLPPLPYPDGRFDLIVNHSVMSHLDEAYQDAWLAELGRVLAPGGVLMLTVHGAYAHALWASGLPRDELKWMNDIEASNRALADKGFYFWRDGGWSGHFPKYYQNTFHTAGYVFEHWSRHFDVLSYIPRGSLGHQDMVVLRHKGEAVAPPPPATLSRRASLSAKWLRHHAGLAVKSARRRLGLKSRA